MNERKPMRTISVTGIAVLAFASCVPDTAGDDPTSPPSASTSDEAAAGWSVEQALGQVPASAGGDPLWLSGADLDAALEASGLQRGSADDPNPEWIRQLSGNPPGDSHIHVGFPELLAVDQATTRRITGFDLGQADGFVTVGRKPDTFTVVTGDLGEDSLADSLVEVDGPIRSDIEGEDRQISQPGNPDALDWTGAPTRLAAKDGAIALSASTEAVKAWLDSGDTLADDTGLASLAGALDERGAVSVVISGPVAFNPSAGHSPDTTAEVPFDAVALAWTGEKVLVAYRVDSEADAAAFETIWKTGQLSTSGQPIDMFASVDGAEVGDGVAVVTLTLADGVPPIMPLMLLEQADGRFASR
ncbi:hypothetical protein [Tessaracoccus flavescens]|nr:hypothetical protein [Tessaracoccus flavescens]